MKDCCICNQELEYKEKEESMQYKGGIIFVLMTGLYCSNCNEFFFNPQETKKVSKRIKEAKENYKGK